MIPGISGGFRGLNGSADRLGRCGKRRTVTVRGHRQVSMSNFKEKRARDKFRKRIRQGNRGYPVATIAFYGPTDEIASKVVVSLIEDDGGRQSKMERWRSESGGDLRKDAISNARVVSLLDLWKPKSIVSPDRIIGCPHEEGIDYPEGQACPECPFWKNIDRWSGETEH